MSQQTTDVLIFPEAGLPESPCNYVLTWIRPNREPDGRVLLTEQNPSLARDMVEHNLSAIHILLSSIKSWGSWTPRDDQVLKAITTVLQPIT